MMKFTVLVSMIVAVSTLLVACGESEDKATKAVSAPKPVQTETAKAITPLKPEYLIGKWCHAYSEAGTEREEENYNWVFEEGGKFYIQKSEFSKNLTPATWEIKDNKLKLAGVFPGDFKPVTILSEDEFSLKFFMNLHVKRGSCTNTCDCSCKTLKAIKNDKSRFDQRCAMICMEETIKCGI